MTRPSDREFELKRQIKDLQNKNINLELEIKNLKKQITKSVSAEDKPVKKNTKVVNDPCPSCGCEIKSTALPHARLDLCSKACGYRRVIIGG